MSEERRINVITITFIFIVLLTAYFFLILFAPGIKEEPKESMITEYRICQFDDDIKYYDRVNDLVFVDPGIRGCFVVGKEEDIRDNYSERDFDRNNYDRRLYSIPKG